MCQNFNPPEGFLPDTLQQILVQEDYTSTINSMDLQKTRQSIPFIACGDLSSWDSDASYALPENDYRPLEAVQLPISPPYKEALEKLRNR